MKRFLTVAMAAVAVSVTMTAQTTVQGIPWNGPARSSTLSAPASKAPAIDPSKVAFWTGSGSKASYLMIQWSSDRETCSHVFGYRYDGAKSSWDMISAVVAAHPQLYMLTHVTSMGNTVAGLGLDVDGNGKQLLRLKAGDPVRPDKETAYVVTEAYDYDSWTATDPQDLWNSGWTSNGYWTYYVKDAIADDFEYSQEGPTKRALSDGSVDGWVFRNLGGGEDAADWKSISYDTAPWTATVAVDGISYRPVNTMGVGTEAYATVAPAAYSGQVSIPASVEISGKTHVVSGVEPSAFAGSAITTFTAASSALFLNDEVFKGCVSLASVTLPEGWAGPWLSEGVFEDCSSMTSVPFSDGSAAIPARYAAGSGLTEFTVPESVKTVGSRALAAPGLVSVKSLSRQPAECAADAFTPAKGAKLTVPLGCSGLYSSADGWKAFADIEEYMPEGYVPVGTKFQVGDLWYEVTSNEPNEVCVAYPGPTNPNNYAWNLANAYNDVADKIFINGGSNGREWQLRLPATVQYPEKGEFAVTGIGRFAFAKVNCPTVKNLTIKNADGGYNENIRSIGSYAFAGNNSSGLYLPPMVETIGEYAFSEMKELITLDCDNPEPPITEIPAGMCSNDPKLRYCVPLYFGKVTKVGAKAFYYHPKDFHVESELSWLEEVGDQAFYSGYTSTSNYVYPIPVTDRLRRIGNSAFMNCQLSVDGGSTFTMRKDGVYGTAALQYTTGIDKIVVEEDVKEIPGQLFQYMENVASVDFPASLETIGACAFLGAKALTEVSFPDGLKTIADRAFRGTGLTKVDLPASVEVCEGLWAIDALMEINIPEDSRLQSATFSQTGITTVFIPDGVVTMPSFSYCSNFTGYTGARNVTSLPNYAFANTAVQTAQIPAKTGRIGDFAWSNCQNVKEIVIPEGVAQLGTRIAYQAKALERIVLPASVKTVDKTLGTFSGVPATTDLWMCYTDYSNPGYYASYLIPEIAWGSTPAQHFAHYYVLSGRKSKADSWADGSFTTTEVSLSVDFPEEHAVASEWDEGLDQSDVMIEVVPSVSLAAESLANEDIPAAFMDANMKLMLTDNRGKALFAGEYRPEGTEAAWMPFEVEVVAPSAEARTMPEWKYVMKADDLTPGMQYEYTLSRLNGQTLIPENVVRYFTAASGTSVGVDELETSDGEGAVRVYDASGTLLPGLRKGINIVVGQDGKARKVFVRE